MAAGDNNNDRYKGKGKWNRPRANDSRNSKRHKAERKDEEVSAKRENRNREDAAEPKETRQPREGSGDPRRPKRKVACLIGYCGTGYHGMQVNPPEKTIEGDLFKAFVDAGAISKDNANDPKKSSFMRAARTDKGVHAAGNVVSLKLIIEDEDIVEKINSHLPETIRVWGFTRTNKAFECRKMCGSRIYEYLMPSYAFLPPKPESALAQRVKEANDETPGISKPDPDGEAFWADVRKQLEEAGIDEEDLKRTQKILESQEIELVAQRRAPKTAKAQKPKVEDATAIGSGEVTEEVTEKATEEATEKATEEPIEKTAEITKEGDAAESSKVEDATAETAEITKEENSTESSKVEETTTEPAQQLTEPTEGDANTERETSEGEKLSAVFKKIRTIENSARRAFRIPTERLEAIRTAFKVSEGGHNFHNFTVGKDFKDPSAQRYMKSITVSDPKIINNTEWLSIKIHGQSFMLHQIRKMVAMVALVIRTGCPLDRISQAFNQPRINIPKAPSLGLLLEQPVYEGYNTRLGTFGYDPINFDKYQTIVEAFKMKHIYDKIYSEEAKENVFHGFFAFIDSFRGDPIFDYLTARGIGKGAVVVGKNSKPTKEADVTAFEEESDGELEGDNEG